MLVTTAVLVRQVAQPAQLEHIVRLMAKHAQPAQLEHIVRLVRQVAPTAELENIVVWLVRQVAPTVWQATTDLQLTIPLTPATDHAELENIVKLVARTAQPA